MPPEPVDQAKARLRLLIDSNIFVTLEPYAGALETTNRKTTELARLSAKQGHTLFVHPANRDDVREGKDPLRRTQALAELDKYPQLSEGPVPSRLTDALGVPVPGSNDDRDMRLLAALANNAVAFMITADKKLRRRAARVGLGDRTLSVDDAVEMLRQLEPAVNTPPPRVMSVESYALDGDQSIFQSLRDDYEGFDVWLNDTVRPDADNRDCLVIDEDGQYAAIAIVKRIESNCSYGFATPVSKIATIKVAPDFVGSKYGELLLKAIFAAAAAREVRTVYVEVLPKHEGLVDLLALFGFADSGHITTRGEVVLAKTLIPDPEASAQSPLDFHIAHGPPAIHGAGKVFIIPIQKRWHLQLFPDAPGPQPDPGDQLELLGLTEISTHPWGNALRKAYLSNSQIGQLAPGDTLLFYRSQDLRAVTAIGVVEDTLRSRDPTEIMAFVGRRTVYTPGEITTMCEGVGGVLAILFRQDRFIEPPWAIDELEGNGVVNGPPQSITQIRDGGREWVHQQLAG